MDLDWRDMFIRYVAVVDKAEGVDFLDLYLPYQPLGPWTEEEWEAIKEAVG